MTERSDGIEALEQWLSDRTQREDEQLETPIFWAHAGFPKGPDWLAVQSAEQLAIRISTATSAASNICTVSDSPDVHGRSVTLIGLVDHDTIGWALVLNDDASDDEFSLDVCRRGYPYDNYDSFASLPAAKIAIEWVRYGIVGDHLETRPRDR